MTAIASAFFFALFTSYLASVAADDHEEKKKLALYGSPHYWVKLQDIEVSNGNWHPQFHEDVSSYTLDIQDPHLTDVVLFLTLDIDKYDLTHEPGIEIDGKKIKYSPIEGIRLDLPLNETCEPLDRTIRIRVFDPEPAEGWFSKGGNEFTYEVRLRQPPDFDNIVKARLLTVQDDSGTFAPCHPPFDPRSDNERYRFALPEGVTSLQMRAGCRPSATGLTYDGIEQPMDENKEALIHIDIQLADKTVLVQCQYKDDEYTRGALLQRTYVVDLSHEAHVGRRHVHLTSLADEGSCKQVDAKNVSAGFECFFRKEHVTLVAYWDCTPSCSQRPHLELSGDGFAHTKDIANGIPQKILVPTAATRTYTLKVIHGSSVNAFPVYVYGAGGPLCEETSCPFGTGLKPDYTTRHCTGHGDNCTKTCCTTGTSCQGYKCPAQMTTRNNPEHFMCAGAECSSVDINACCRNVATCEEYQCPQGKVRVQYAKNLKCRAHSCLPEEESMCCEKAATCDSFSCPVCAKKKQYPDRIVCQHGECGQQDLHTCCSFPSSWILGPPGQSCDEVCKDKDGCLADPEVWPKKKQDFLDITGELGVGCLLVQTGEAMYDPSYSEQRHCGWKMYHVTDMEYMDMDGSAISTVSAASSEARQRAAQAFYGGFHCSAEPPPLTQRFCICKEHEKHHKCKAGMRPVESKSSADDNATIIVS
eukprot:TRINITY_DN16999_c0_g1_i1.p1 TRINITY_DN16999_c0_g1~~TRINITY_DN16999_c0_g1_i1.p1  ORF type:complete len:700 (-),score=64.92 TRINITY_DN16999_c0_g1_i1:148-2247(-)